MPLKPKSQKNNTVRKTTMPRVTNQDLNDRLIRMEEFVKPLAEAAARVPALQEAQIRTEGALKDHDSKIVVLFGKAQDHDKSLDTITKEAIPAVSKEIGTSRASAKAVASTLAAVAGIAMMIIGYFVSQQSSAMKDIVENTSKTAGLVIAIDKRLTLAEYELSKLQAAPAAVGDHK